MRSNLNPSFRQVPFIPASELDKAIASLSTTAEQSVAAKNAAAPPAVYAYFDLVKSGTHTIQPKDGGAEQQVPCEWYRCKKHGKGCKVPGANVCKVVRKATSTMLKHLRKCEGEEVWLSVRAESKNSKVKTDADGQTVTLLSWAELLPHHVRFVIYCFQSWDHFAKTRSQYFRDYVSGWNARSSLPARETCVKIIFIIKHLVKARLHALLALIKQQIGSPCCGLLDDIWSKRNCKQSFACARVPLAIDGELLDGFLQSLSSTPLAAKYAGKIVSCSPILAFSTLSSSRHTGHVIARWKRSIFAETKALVIRDVSLATEDGASNNKKSNKLLALPSMVCFPHDLQRCILFGAGLTGTPCRNPQLQAFQKRSSKMVGAFSKSGVATAALMESQRVDENWTKMVGLASPNATRWLGLSRQAKRNRELQPNIATALCGDTAGKEDELEGDENNQDECDSDDDLIESNVRKDKDFPLRHRLLTNDEFNINRQWESVLESPAEVSALLQSHDGTRLEEAHMLVVTLGQSMEAPRLQVVTGRGVTESWEEMPATRLDAMFRDFRRIVAEEANTRFCLKGTPNSHILLALKMSPFIDASPDGMFGKRATQELMDATYKTALRQRQIYMLSAAAPAPAPAPASAASPAVATYACSPAHAPSTPAAASSSAAAGPKKRQKIGALAVTMHSSRKPVMQDNTADALADEIAAYDKIASTVDHSKYILEDDGGRYDLNQFWADHKKTLPIHYNVYLGDCGSKRASSASVETVYSGATKLSDEADCLGDDLLAAYVFLHYNWKFDFLRPTIAEIVAEYKRMHGTHPPPEEADPVWEAEPEEADSEGESD